MGETDNETEVNIAQNDWDFDAEEFEVVSEEGKDFIEKLLVSESRDRLSSEQALLHPWLKRSGNTIL